MEGLLKQLSFYGPIIIRKYGHEYWHCYCEVKLLEFADQKEVAITTGEDLYKTLRELLKQSAITKKKLLDKIHEPKQESFNYGSTNPDYKEIV